MFSKTVFALYDSDKILSFLYNKLFYKFGAFKVSLALFFIPIAMCFIAGKLENTLYNKENFVGVILDYTLYGQWIVDIFSLYLYYMFSIFTKNFLSTEILQVCNFKKLSEAEIEQLDTKLSQIIGAEAIYKIVRIGLILIFLFLYIITVINAFDPIKNYGHDIWHSANHPLGFAVLKLFNFFYATLFLSIFAYKFSASLFGFSWLFRQISKKDAFLIKPLSPDNSAGLKVLSKLSVYFMYMVLPFFLIFITLILRGSKFLISQQIAFLVLIILLFVTFFLPLGAVHAAMKRAKTRELEWLAQHFSYLNKTVKEKMEGKNYNEEFISDINSLEKIDFLYNKTEKMPVWPFNFSHLGKFLVAALVPIFVFIIQMVVNADSILYNWDRIEIFFKKLFYS